MLIGEEFSGCGRDRLDKDRAPDVSIVILTDNVGRGFHEVLC
jgi:hypothetical protein